MDQDKPIRRSRDAAVGIGAVAVAVVCCAGPTLVGAGVLGTIGGLTRDPLIAAAAVLVAVGAVWGTFYRRRARATGPCDPVLPPVAGGGAPSDATTRAPAERS